MIVNDSEWFLIRFKELDYKVIPYSFKMINNGSEWFWMILNKIQRTWLHSNSI
jgi:hypothetical protein